MRFYCTLFDSGYMARGLVMYQSLIEHSSEPFVLYVLPMDAEAECQLEIMQLPNVEVVTNFHEHHHGMKEAKANRTHQEYCWTCASNLAEALMATLNIEEITYLDADMMFFADPKVVFDEIGDRSIAVVPHRFIPSKRHLQVNGQFNVSWVTFRGFAGRDCLTMWAWQCRDRCSAMIGCGDQVYLDEWPARYKDELCVISNIGAGLAPWNLANYQLAPGPTVDGKPVIFYHYHEFAQKEDGTFRLTNYELRAEDVEIIYRPYIQRYKQALLVHQ